MKNDRIKRVEQMEKIMDKSADIFRELGTFLFLLDDFSPFLCYNKED